MTRFLVFIAQGFGLGRLPFAPGTFGSLLGLGWVAMLVRSESYSIFAAGTLVGLALSVWLCGVAEQALQKKDPGSVVLDEIAAMPICFAGWISVHWFHHHRMPSLDVFLAGEKWLLLVGVFVLFRVFDIWKPWPIRASQSLSGGWGVTMDDLLAAVCVAVITGAAAAGLHN